MIKFQIFDIRDFIVVPSGDLPKGEKLDIRNWKLGA